MSNLNNPLRIFANRVHIQAIPVWLYQAYAGNHSDTDYQALREDARKTIQYLDGGKKRERIIGGCVGFAIWIGMWLWLLGRVTEQGRAAMFQDFINKPLPFFIVTSSLILFVSFSVFYRDMGDSDGPKYYRHMERFHLFVKGLRRHLGDGPWETSELSDIPMEWALNQADKKIIELAKRVIFRSDITKGGRIDWPATNEAGIELNERFDYFKKLGLVTTDKQGGYGWHFEQAKRQIAEV